jgi:hypothetical protein
MTHVTRLVMFFRAPMSTRCTTNMRPCAHITPPPRLCAVKDAKRLVMKIERDAGLAPKTLYNIEHIVPRKLSWPEIEWDLHNLVLMDAMMNSVRSASRLINFRSGSTRIWIAGEMWCVHPFGFTPPPSYRGRYARGAAYAIFTNPASADLVARLIIDPKTLLEWHIDNPACAREIEASIFKCSIQGQKENVVVEDPDFVPELIHSVYSKFPGFASTGV